MPRSPPPTETCFEMSRKGRTSLRRPWRTRITPFRSTTKSRPPPGGPVTYVGESKVAIFTSRTPRAGLTREAGGAPRSVADRGVRSDPPPPPQDARSTPITAATGARCRSGRRTSAEVNGRLPLQRDLADGRLQPAVDVVRGGRGDRVQLLAFRLGERLARAARELDLHGLRGGRRDRERRAPDGALLRRAAGLDLGGELEGAPAAAQGPG